MKVAFLVGTLQAGGLERFVTRMSLEARRTGAFDPVVICLNRRVGIFLDDLVRADVPVVEAPRQWYRSPFKFLQLVKLLRILNADIIHSQVNYSIVQQFVAASLSGTQFTITERNCYVRTGLALVRRRIQYRILKIFGVTYSANSDRVASHLANMLKEDVRKFPILPNGVLVFERAASATEPTLGSITIGYISRMASHKGHLFFLKVFAELVRERQLNCTAVLIGDGPMRREIEQMIQTLEISTSVRLTGVVSNVDRYLRECDIVSLLSDYEGMPNVVIEAMAAGIPVIATDVGNTAQLLGSGAGIVVTKHSVKTVADQFQYLIEHPDERLKMGRVGLEVVRTHFSLERSLDILQDYYSSLLKL